MVAIQSVALFGRAALAAVTFALVVGPRVVLVLVVQRSRWFRLAYLLAPAQRRVVAAASPHFFLFRGRCRFLADLRPRWLRTVILVRRFVLSGVFLIRPKSATFSPQSCIS